MRSKKKNTGNEDHPKSTRVILYTGKGGVGKTSVAASTAIICAETGFNTLVVSTDAAHSLSDAFGVDIGSEIMEIGENLCVQEISVTEAISHHWENLKNYLTALFSSQGLDPISSEEIATLPGFEEASELLYVNDYVKSKKYDVIIMDSAPTGESLKLLSFPEAMSWYMEKMFPISRTTAKIFRPVVKPFTNIPLPDDSIFSSMEGLYKSLRDVKNILTDNDVTSIRLVTTPDRMSLNETKRAFTYLLLYGYPIDAVIVNKIYQQDTGPFFKKWRNTQSEIIKEMEDAFHDVKMFRANLSETEPNGIDNLRELGHHIYGNENPLRIFTRNIPIKYSKTPGGYRVKLRLPFATKERMRLYNKGGELVIELDNWRRVFYLPQTMASKQPVSAEFNNGFLNIDLR